MVIELFNDFVSPRLSDRDETGIDTIEQTKLGEQSHSPWVDRAAIEGHLVIDLDIVGNAHAIPHRPNCIQNALSGTGEYGLHPAAVYRNVNGI